MKNIKNILTTILVIGCFITAKGQGDTPSQGIRFGLKGGINHSNVYDTYGENFQTNPKIGLMGGAFLSIPIGPFLGVQPEFLFSQKGFSGDGRVKGSYYAYSHTSTYFEIPLLLQVKPLPALTLLAGPQFAYLIHTRDVFSNSEITSVQEREIANNNPRKNVLGAVGGFDINIQHLVLAGRLGWDLQNNNGDGTSTSPRYSNIWLQAAVGFRF